LESSGVAHGASKRRWVPQITGDTLKVVQMYKQNGIGNEMQVIAQYIASPFSVFCDSTEHSMQGVLPYTANCPGPLTLVEIRRNK